MTRPNRIRELTQLVPPPTNPRDADESHFNAIRGCLRTDFPDDFVEFGRMYGSGEFRSAYSWEVWSPFRKTYPAIVMEFSRIQFLYKAAREVDDVPFGIFPEEGGMLPFAKTPDGDWVGWITEGEPNDWKVFDLYAYENGFFEVLDVNFSEYLLRVLDRSIVLERHREGNAWDPKTDLRFTQDVFADRFRD